MRIIIITTATRRISARRDIDALHRLS